MSDPLTDLINDIQHNGVRWVTLVTLYSLYRKERRNTLLNKRDQANFANQREVMNALGVGDKWIDGPKHGLIQMDPLILRRFFLLSHKVTILRRKKTMGKLKSRKLWLAIFGALFPVLNVELGINLDPNIVFAVLGVVVSGIAGLAHVDGKRAQAVVDSLKESVSIDPNATYKDMFPTIKEVHDKVNKFLELAKTNDVNVLAIYPHLLELLSSYEQPEPVAIIPDEQVSA